MLSLKQWLVTSKQIERIRLTSTITEAIAVFGIRIFTVADRYRIQSLNERSVVER